MKTSIYTNFYSQVAALTEYPALIDSPLATQLFPQDAIDRARSLLSDIGSVGAYTHSKGVPIIRQHVAEFIEKRDGFPADPEHIYLTSGASSGVSSVMNILVQNASTGIMIPIPQYPLCTFSITCNQPRADLIRTSQTRPRLHSKMRNLYPTT